MRLVPRERLFVSEPPPQWFGNDPNPREGAPGWTNGNWLKSRFHFNFAEYSSGPAKFGCLRVMNDDLVQPARGFGTHPHKDAEIITFVVQGELTHQDSMGTSETLGRGSIQFMTAGRGIRHSEHNLSKDSDLRFIQCWVTPRSLNLPPNYGSMLGDNKAADARRDTWAHLVSDVSGDAKTPVQINQDCNVFVVEVSPGRQVPPLDIARGRQGYMLCVEGALQAMLPEGGLDLRRHDAAEIKGPMSVSLRAHQDEGAMVLLFEMAESSDARRDI